MHTPVDLQKTRREYIRWVLLLGLNNSRPIGTVESVLLSIVQALHPDATALEIRCELDYLSERELVKLEKRPIGVWKADLTRAGIDMVQYTIDCEPGIARPVKYW